MTVPLGVKRSGHAHAQVTPRLPGVLSTPHDSDTASAAHATSRKHILITPRSSSFLSCFISRRNISRKLGVGRVVQGQPLHMPLYLSQPFNSVLQAPRTLQSCCHLCTRRVCRM